MANLHPRKPDHVNGPSPADKLRHLYVVLSTPPTPLGPLGRPPVGCGTKKDIGAIKEAGPLFSLSAPKNLKRICSRQINSYTLRTSYRLIPTNSDPMNNGCRGLHQLIQ